MSEKSKIVLKTKFEAGQIPTEEDFGDLLDSSINKVDDQVAIRNIGRGKNAARYVGIGSVDPESPLSVRNRGKKQNLIGFEDVEGNEKWQIEIDPEKGSEGLNIKEKGAESGNLFIQSGGNVGLGTKAPKEKLEVLGTVKAARFEGKMSWNNLEDVPEDKTVPAGVILMWHGSIEKIPKGWVLCDGQNGSPDLRDRFVTGAGSSYAVGSTGGANSVKLTIGQMPAHTHPINPSGNHRHSYSRGEKRGDGASGSGGANDGHSTRYTAYDGNHSHVAGKTGQNQTHENRPPYYALCFIMKI